MKENSIGRESKTDGNEDTESERVRKRQREREKDRESKREGAGHRRSLTPTGCRCERQTTMRFSGLHRGLSVPPSPPGCPD